MEQYVYIHGVVAEQDRRAKHTKQYRAIRNGIDRELRKLGGDPLPAIDSSVTVEWGWDTPDAGETRTLAIAQSSIANRVKLATPRDRTGFASLLFAPAVKPVRKLIMFGLSDILYYVGKRGKKLVRSLVWNQILDQIDTEQEVDLTIICHSGGTLIAHDFLFWVFSGDRDDHDEIIEQGIDPSKVVAAANNWRIRRLVTFGSPISPLMVRSAYVTDKMAASPSARLDATKLGLGRLAHSGETPIWLNVWDRHDVLSYPVGPFYEGANIVDLYPDHSDSLRNSHEAYWTASSVHHDLAEHWKD